MEIHGTNRQRIFQAEVMALKWKELDIFKEMREKHCSWRRVAHDEVRKESKNLIMLPFGDHTEKFSFGISNVKVLAGFNHRGEMICFMFCFFLNKIHKICR